MGFDFTVECRVGGENVVADALSHIDEDVGISMPQLGFFYAI